MPTPSFFSLTLAKREREEELSRTLNKGPAPLWSTGGLLSLGWLISNSPPWHLGTYALPPGQGHTPPIQCAGKSFLPLGSSTAPWSRPRSQGDSRRQHRLGYFLKRGEPFPSAAGGGAFLPASSSEKSAPYGAKQIALASGPSQSHIKKLGVSGSFSLTE